MAHVWLKRDGEWAAAPLAGAAFALCSGGAPRVGGGAESGSGPAARLPSYDASGREAWVLLAHQNCRVRVNGFAVRAGIRVLCDRDEISLPDSGRVFYSTERLSSVVPFPGTARRVDCPRGLRQIHAGEPSVRCPQCDVWLHESGEFLCWTHAPQCPSCGGSTELDAGFSWTPDEI